MDAMQPHGPPDSPALIKTRGFDVARPQDRLSAYLRPLFSPAASPDGPAPTQMFGFGAMLPDGTVSHCFAMNFNEQQVPMSPFFSLARQHSFARPPARFSGAWSRTQRHSVRS